MAPRHIIPLTAFQTPSDKRLAEARNAKGDLVEVVHPRISDAELLAFIRQSRSEGLTVMVFPE